MLVKRKARQEEKEEWVQLSLVSVLSDEEGEDEFRAALAGFRPFFFL